MEADHREAYLPLVAEVHDLTFDSPDHSWSWTSEQLRSRPESLPVACLMRESSFAVSQMLKVDMLAGGTATSRM